MINYETINLYFKKYTFVHIDNNYLFNIIFMTHKSYHKSLLVVIGYYYKIHLYLMIKKN